MQDTFDLTYIGTVYVILLILILLLLSLLLLKILLFLLLHLLDWGCLILIYRSLNYNMSPNFLAPNSCRVAAVFTVTATVAVVSVPRAVDVVTVGTFNP